ncbi:hypothetical protein [Actibacterium ureilyticum]|uniref:hypothetical protein n=1 Tax=Actibacterium ureilyticum TaxID=1590614 RepID=UPI001140D46D|nr:hypothetical protein [Actibacterium ureilyticum]
MADALSRLETLNKSYKYLSGAKDVLDNTLKVKKLAESDPRDIDALRKVAGVSSKVYAPLKKFLSGVHKEVNETIKAGFPEIPDPSLETRKRMEKIARSSGPNTPGFEKELDAYIKTLTRYERDLRERDSYMQMVIAKCELNQKNYMQMQGVISSTMKALKAAFAAIPEARSEVGGEILKIMEAGIEKHPQGIAIAFGRLKTAAAAHQKEIRVQHKRAKSALKVAGDRKLRLLMEDASAFFKKLF